MKRGGPSHYPALDEDKMSSLAGNKPGNEGVSPSSRAGCPRSQRVPCASAQRSLLRKLPGSYCSPAGRFFISATRRQLPTSSSFWL